jgi:hypothetical protein
VIIRDALYELEYRKGAGVPPRGVDAVDYFIFVAQEGDCMNFASAMAVMLRSVGVPARLSSGYLRGELDEDRDGFIIRARDYHARPEVYFPGYGWVEFEPTPISENEEDVALDDDDWIDEYESDEELTAAGSRTTDPMQLWLSTLLAIIGISLGLLFVLGSGSYYWLRRFKRGHYASEAYSKMCFLASLFKSGPSPHDTPLEYCTRLSMTFPLQAEAIGHIGHTYVESRFSQRKTLEAQQEESLYQSWRDVYRALVKRVLRLGG